MSLLKKIKQGVERSGSNKGKILFLRPDSKTRIRFLHEIEDGIEVLMHDHFQRGVNTVCQEVLGKDCPYCNDEDLRHRDNYVWCVWDYEANEVKLFMGIANNFSPLPSFISMYESYGTIMDRDYVIHRQGSQMNTRYSVVPMDKVKFKNKKAKPYSEKKMIDILAKAFPVNESDLEGNDDDDYENEDIENDDDDFEEYEGLTPRELYEECIDRGLKVKKKQKKQYYIDILVEDDESDEEEWEEDDDDEDDSDW